MVREARLKEECGHLQKRWKKPQEQPDSLRSSSGHESKVSIQLFTEQTHSWCSHTPSDNESKQRIAMAASAVTVVREVLMLPERILTITIVTYMFVLTAPMSLTFGNNPNQRRETNDVNKSYACRHFLDFIEAKKHSSKGNANNVTQTKQTFFWRRSSENQHSPHCFNFRRMNKTKIEWYNEWNHW